MTVTIGSRVAKDTLFDGFARVAAALASGRRLEIIDLLSAEGSSVVLAEDEDAGLVGCVHVRREGADDAHLGMLSVDPARQAKGVGRDLIERAEATARGWGCMWMRMHVLSARPELLAYYERRGYGRTGVEEPFDVPERIGRSRVGVLRFLELQKRLRDA